MRFYEKLYERIPQIFSLHFFLPLRNFHGRSRCIARSSLQDYGNSLGVELVKGHIT